METREVNWSGSQTKRQGRKFVIDPKNPYLDAYRKIDLIVMARIRERLDGKNPRKTVFSFSYSCVVSEWHHSYTRESDVAYSALQQKGAAFFPLKNASSTIRAQQAP
uniref:Uncharacterized protein n=1 Tax=Lactuca sativa TaxID=4236 RepID=A0A9R1VDT9_LACSA|nr:hypothetical protein LSAT_V11C500284750 [Lactuca sativa]